MFSNILFPEDFSPRKSGFPEEESRGEELRGGPAVKEEASASFCSLGWFCNPS